MERKKEVMEIGNYKVEATIYKKGKNTYYLIIHPHLPHGYGFLPSGHDLKSIYEKAIRSFFPDTKKIENIGGYKRREIRCIERNEEKVMFNIYTIYLKVKREKKEEKMLVRLRTIGPPLHNY